MSSSPHIPRGNPTAPDTGVQAVLRIQAIVAVLVGCAVALLDAFGGRFDRMLVSGLMVVYGLAGIKLAASRSQPAPVIRERPSPRPPAEAMATGGWRAKP